MDPNLLSALTNIGLGVCANGIYDMLNKFKDKIISQDQLSAHLENKIREQSLTITAEQVLNLLNKEGFFQPSKGITAVSIQGQGKFSDNTLTIGKISGCQTAISIDQQADVRGNTIDIGKIEK